MKKNISISIEDTLLEDLEKMILPENEDRPSITNMIEHLVKTNTKYLLFKANEKRKGKLSGNKLKD